jgi:hypothetical protein
MLLAIRDSNLGTIVIRDHKIVDGDKATFGRAFWAFNALINGFQYCHPLISIDDTHLYSQYKVKLLVVVAYDANNRAYPLCFTIVKKEMNNNWSWFLDLLH